MRAQRDRGAWVGVLFALLATGVLFGSVFMVNAGALLPSASAGAPSGVVAATGNGTGSLWSDLPAITNNVPAPDTPICQLAQAFEFNFFTLGPACQPIPPPWSTYVEQNALAQGVDLMIGLANALNQTASFTSYVNATAQELLSYFESRAEAIVPYFLNYTWNQTTYDAIATLSGLVPAIEGMVAAISQQQYQDWNAFAQGWNNSFGPGGGFAGNSASIVFNATASNTTLVTDGGTLTTTGAWQYWYGPFPSGQPPGVPAGPYYFNLMPGGTIVDANIQNYSSPTYCTFVVNDVTKGTSFVVPSVSFQSFVTGTGIPLVSTVNGIGQFDLLYLTDPGGCTATSAPFLEVAGGYQYLPASTENPDTQFQNTHVSLIQLYNGLPNNYFFIPNTLTNGLCFSPNTMTGPGTGGGPCAATTQPVPTEGNAAALGSGVGSVASSNNTLTQYAATFQTLVNRTMSMAYVYYTVLQAVTSNGTYAIPADCSIPTPSDAFPAATNYADYAMSVNNIGAVYVAYLDSVAREYNTLFSQSTNFCGDDNLGFHFGWADGWDLKLNVTASIYLASPSGPVTPNGSSDASSLYASPSTWPITGVAPTLLLPFEYQLDVPVGVVYPVPINDPVAAVEVNYAGNSYYGEGGFTPEWGVPTYLSLNGAGNYVFTSGFQSTFGSGRANSSGAAIYVSSCLLNGVPQNPCDIAVTYFNNFTVGIQHGIIGPPPPPGGSGGPGGTLGEGCGFGALNQWYDGWAGYIGFAVSSAFSYLGDAVSNIPIIGGGLANIIDGVGCFVAWVILILIFVVLVYVAARVLIGMYRSFHERRGSMS